MKKVIVWIIGIVVVSLFLVAIAGMIKFNILVDDIYNEQGQRI